jgi:TolB-like protein
LSLWSEIRQRRITQIVITYLAGGWMVLAVFDQVVDREVLPLVVYEVALTLYVFGIAAALIIGWYHGEKGAQRAQPLEIAMLTVVGLFGAAASAMVIRASFAEAALEDAIDPDDLRRIAVLYLEDLSRDGSIQPVADGITEGLITSLASVRELDVRSRNASREARALGDVPVSTIADFLEVGALVDGTVDQVGDELRVSVRLLEGNTGAPLFRETFEWPAEDVAALGSNLATEVAAALRSRLGVEIRLREGEAEAPNAAAWLQVARGERFLQEADAALAAGDPEGYVAALESAEAELLAAQESAPDWAEPLVLRSQVAYEWYPLAGSLEELVEFMDRAVELADAALRIDPNDPAALEWRGTAAYRKWLNLRGQPTESDDLDAIFAQARRDLERSETIDPDRASANSTLSHLHYQIDDPVGAALAARTAYEQDAFLTVADEVLWRLFTTSYDLGEAPNAESWCEEGRDRFPDDFRFRQCQILVMTMPSITRDVDRAWSLHAELLPLLTEQPEFFDAQGRMMIGAIIGLAGMPDSADVVITGARLGPDLDPVRELVSFEAAMRSLLGEADEAVDLLERYVLANPEHEIGEHWWWRNLAGNPDFERLRSR